MAGLFPRKKTEKKERPPTYRCSGLSISDGSGSVTQEYPPVARSFFGLLLSAFGGRGSRACPTKGNRDSVAEAYHRARATTHVSPTRVSAREGVRDGRGSARTRGSSGGRHRSRGSFDRGIRNRARAAESLLTGSLTSRDRHGGREGTSHTPRVRPSDRNAVDHTAARRFSRLARVERVLPARAPPPNDKESPRDKTARGDI
jgi:hypothetical protein